MTIAERRQRQKEDLSKKILDAAMELFTQQGFEQTSIRNIAKEIDYSPTTIYLYFKDKDAIFHALHQQGFDMLSTRMQMLMHVDDPFERLKAMGKIYIAFALENPKLYELMFVQSAPIDFVEASEETSWSEGSNAFFYLKQTLTDCKTTGRFPILDIEPTAFVIWSTLHGMVTLQIKNRCKAISPDNRAAIVEMGYKNLVHLLHSLGNE